MIVGGAGGNNCGLHVPVNLPGVPHTCKYSLLNYLFLPLMDDLQVLNVSRVSCVMHMNNNID